MGLIARRRAESSNAASAIYDNLAVNTDPTTSGSPEVVSDTPSMSALLRMWTREKQGRKGRMKSAPLAR